MNSIAHETHYDVIILGAGKISECLASNYLAKYNSGLYGLAFANTWLRIHPEARLVILEARPCLGGVWSSERMYDGNCEEAYIP